MNIHLRGLNINYEIKGTGNDVLILHGWGCEIKTVEPIMNLLSDRFRVTALDFPGFGKSEEPKNPWGIDEYAIFVQEFIEEVGIKNPVLIGHSHGGRTILYLVGKLLFSPRKIILIDSAGIKPKRNLKYHYKVYSFKLIKRIMKLLLPAKKADEIINRARNKRGSEDYRNASPILRQSLSKLVNCDLRKFFTNIKVPTLLIWGEDDLATPVSDAIIMEKMIKDCGLVKLSKAGHFSYLDKPTEFNIIVNEFLRKDANNDY